MMIFVATAIAAGVFPLRRHHVANKLGNEHKSDEYVCLSVRLTLYIHMREIIHQFSLNK